MSTIKTIERKELNKRMKHEGNTRKVLCRCARNIYFIDLIDFSSKQDNFVQNCIESYYKQSGDEHFNLKSKNNGYNYVLVCVDGYSRFIMTRNMKTKSSKEVVKYMTQIIEKNGPPNYICCDYGKEFINSEFKTSILKKYNIKMYHVYSPQKAILAERAIRTIKENIRSEFIDSGGTWFKFIDPCVEMLNKRVHNSTGRTPDEVFNHGKLYREIEEPSNLTEKDTEPQFQVGDHVRTSVKLSPLQKPSLNYHWSKEVFEISEIDMSAMPIMYRVKGSAKPYYHWQLLESQCPVSLTRDQSPVTLTEVQTHSQTQQVEHAKSKVNDFFEPNRYNTRHKQINFKQYR